MAAAARPLLVICLVPPVSPEETKRKRYSYRLQQLNSMRYRHGSRYVY
mgnify:CR=1 FL=1